MYELEDANIVEINDATINGDFNWVLVTLNDNSCYMIMITKIRRKTYKCSNTVSFKSIRFLNSDPLVIGNDVTGIINTARLKSDRFEIKWHKQVTGQRSTEMFLYDSNDNTDTSDAMAVFITSPDNFPMMMKFSYKDGEIFNNKILQYSMTSPRILYSNTQKDYILSGEIRSSNQLVFVRFSASFSFGDLRVTKANNQALYQLVPETVIVDTNANIIFGGVANAQKFMIYMTGEELSGYS